MKNDGYTYGNQSKEGSHFIFRVGGSEDIKEDDMVLDVFGQQHEKYMFFCEHLESIHGGAKAGALDSNKASDQVLERYNGVWIEISWRMWHEVAGILIIKLGRECSRKKENLRVLLQLSINSDYMVQ
jgi:hypothetical protein